MNSDNPRKWILFSGFSLIVILSTVYCLSIQSENPIPTLSTIPRFDHNRAFSYVEQQVGWGPRVPGTPAHQSAIDWMFNHLRETDWQVSKHTGSLNGQPFVNILAERNPDSQKWVIIGAHYDSREYADQDPIDNHRAEAVLGANDGASGVAVLMELSNIIPKDLSCHVTLAFFDQEDQGRIREQNWITGSTAYADQLRQTPDAVIIVDMVGDRDLAFYRERNSTAALTDEIWQIADSLGYGGIFINEEKYRIIDDHLPFIEKQIPAVDIIDFDYPAWHTTGDTLDQVAPDSLKIVGDTLITWLIQSDLCAP